jgi:CDP-diacylglycerol--glycerol-3-phosphate 3-phosphatidyltransferase
MIVRDVVVDASRMYAASQGRVIAADIYGKLKTIFQMAGIIVILFLFNETPQAKSFQYGDCSIYYWTIQNGLLFIATFMSILSGINYIIKIYRPFNKSHK